MTCTAYAELYEQRPRERLVIGGCARCHSANLAGSYKRARTLFELAYSRSGRPVARASAANMALKLGDAAGVTSQLESGSIIIPPGPRLGARRTAADAAPLAPRAHAAALNAARLGAQGDACSP